MRQLVYETLVGDATLMAMLTSGTDSVFQGESLQNAPADDKFIIYSMGVDSAEFQMPAHRQFIQIAFHDKARDFMAIDSGISRIKTLFVNAPQSATHKFYQAIYLETSRDFDDHDLNTLFRYIRFQLIAHD